MATQSSHRPVSAAPRPAKGVADSLFASGVEHLGARRIPEAIDAFQGALAADPLPERQAAILRALGHAARALQTL